MRKICGFKLGCSLLSTSCNRRNLIKCFPLAVLPAMGTLTAGERMCKIPPQFIPRERKKTVTAFLPFISNTNWQPQSSGNIVTRNVLRNTLCQWFLHVCACVCVCVCVCVYIYIYKLTAIQFSLCGSSPYTSTNKTNNIHKRNNTKTQYRQYKTVNKSTHITKTPTYNKANTHTHTLQNKLKQPQHKIHTNHMK